MRQLTDRFGASTPAEAGQQKLLFGRGRGAAIGAYAAAYLTPRAIFRSGMSQSMAPSRWGNDDLRRLRARVSAAALVFPVDPSGKRSTEAALKARSVRDDADITRLQACRK